MPSKPRTARKSKLEPQTPQDVLMREFPGLLRPAAKSIVAKVRRALKAPPKPRISREVDDLLARLRSDANADVVDELADAIEDYGKDEYDGGSHEGYDRGCEDTEHDNDD